MNTINPKTDTGHVLSIKSAKPTSVDTKKDNDTTRELLDSPRGFLRTVKKPKTLVKQDMAHTDVSVSKLPSIRTTLKAQKEAGKNDSAEMYRGVFSPRPASPSETPRSPAPAPRVKLTSLTAKEAAALSDDAFNDLIVGDESDATLNTGWNEWGIDSDSDDDAGKPSTKSGAVGDVAQNGRSASLGKTRSDAGENRWWDDWAIGSDDEE